MADSGDWTCDANDAIQLTLVKPGEQKPTTAEIFHPQFTYPIFGDEEQIFGYKGLIIRLRFATHDLRTHVHISFDEKFKAVGDAAAVDLNKTLREWVSESAFTKLSDYEISVQNDPKAKDFTPPGKLVHSYKSKNRNYEIWAGSLADDAVRNLLGRAQVFIPFFIEGGTPLILDDPEWTLERWTVYFVYEKTTPITPTESQYSFVGYSTVYRWWFFSEQHGDKVVKNDTFPYPEELRFSQLPSRSRIAQFLILPPHQGSGHGSQLYNVIHKACIADKTVVELTVEDPNESFDVLRDSADYHNLYHAFLDEDININPNPYADLKVSGKRRPRNMPTSSLIPTQKLAEIRTKYKIAPTQFAHILEMYLLSRIPPRKRGGTNMARLLIKKHNAAEEDDRRYYWWRMLVKQRLYKRSRDILIQLELQDRIQKLDETVTNVEEGYDQLLTVFDARERGRATFAPDVDSDADAVITAGGVTTMHALRAKRKYAIEDDEDEDEEDDDVELIEAGQAAKRPKI